MGTVIKKETLRSTGVTQQLISRVVLFNDDWHSFDDVIVQIIKAVGCSLRKAESLTFKVHHEGKACVYSGELDKCLHISNVLEEIRLSTQVTV